MTILHEYIDRHISGKTDDRAAFQQMIKDSSKGAFDAVICWKTDRLPGTAMIALFIKSSCGIMG